MVAKYMRLDGTIISVGDLLFDRSDGLYRVVCACEFSFDADHPELGFVVERFTLLNRASSFARRWQVKPNWVVLPALKGHLLRFSPLWTRESEDVFLVFDM